MHGSDWRIMVLARLVHSATLTNIALVDVEVLRAHIKVLLFALGKVQTMCVDLLTILPACNRTLGLLRRGRCISWVLWNAKEVEVLRVDKHSRPPVAHLSIVTNAHD